MCFFGEAILGSSGIFINCFENLFDLFILMLIWVYALVDDESKEEEEESNTLSFV